MDAQEQRLEIEPAVADDHDLAVHDAALGQRGSERDQELWEVSVHGFPVAALEQNLIAVTKHQRAKTVPLGLEQPPVALGQSICRTGQHGLEWGSEGKAHETILEASGE